MTGFAGSVTLTAFPDLSAYFLKNGQFLRGLRSKI
ncbi:ABC transporter ATP-binding protein [Enterobacter ludwigii]|nr:ABC transporter ATP-binding protein [Enterobacter ludwigii]QCU07978.1 ABC transporter ATP-binding protein [Enterobacter ludwigii]